MAKTKNTTRKPAKKKEADSKFRPQIHIRMYCQGLGDCFLLQIEREPKKYVNILIDCGIYKASPDAKKIMNQVVEDIAEATGNHLHVLVSTHEHWDHISGFYQALSHFEKMKIDEVWQAWTEDPDYGPARELRKKYEKAKARLTGLLRTAQTALGSKPSPALDDAFHIMGFFGVDKEGDEKDAYEVIKKLMKDNKPCYLKPGEIIPNLGDSGVTAYVLGPPEDESLLRKTNFAKKDGYEKQKEEKRKSRAAFFEGIENMLGAAASLLEEPEGEEPVNDMTHPFGPRWEIPLEAARESEYFQTLYGFEADHPEAFRSIDDIAYDTLGSLALRMDSYTNNTSLVLAFKLPNGNVLLFPGDAQGGNWKSWADLQEPLEFDEDHTTSHDLLENTVLYKVGHHGSHNATPSTFGLDLMKHRDLRAFVPVDHTVAAGAGYGEMPLFNIMKVLDLKTDGRCFRSDGDVSKVQSNIFRLSSKKLTVQPTKDSDSVTRPLYCETSFELD